MFLTCHSEGIQYYSETNFFLNVTFKNIENKRERIQNSKERDVL